MYRLCSITELLLDGVPSLHATIQNASSAKFVKVRLQKIVDLINYATRFTPHGSFIQTIYDERLHQATISHEDAQKHNLPSGTQD